MMYRGYEIRENVDGEMIVRFGDDEVGVSRTQAGAEFLVDQFLYAP